MSEPVTLTTLEEDHYVVAYGDGRREAVPVRISDEESARVEAATLRRELDGIEFRLAHLDDPPMPWQEPPWPEKVERERTSLQNTRTVILARLAELEPAPKGRRK